MKISQSVLTYSGQYVNLLEPVADSIVIADIAHALSQVCRFGGHTRQFYSVAQHCVLVSELLPLRFKLHGLLHDAAESYFGDMVQPVKYLPGAEPYRDHESMMQARIFDRFGLGMTQTPECLKAIHEADLILLATERRDLMHPDVHSWPILEGIAPRRRHIVPLMPQAAESAFLRAFKDLTGEQ